MPKQRRNFSGAEKIAILREHLLDKVPISEVCEQHGLQPTMFYNWQKKLFENGATVFDQPGRKSSRQKAAGGSAANDSRKRVGALQLLPQIQA